MVANNIHHGSCELGLPEPYLYPNESKTIVLWALFQGIGPLSYILLVSRYTPWLIRVFSLNPCSHVGKKAIAYSPSQTAPLEIMKTGNSCSEQRQ